MSNPAPRTALPYPCVSSRPRWRVSDDVLFLCPSERCTKASANGTNTHQLSIDPPTIPDLPPGLQLKRHARLALRIYNDPPVSRPSCTLTPIPTVLHDGTILQRIDLSCTTVSHAHSQHIGVLAAILACICVTTCTHVYYVVHAQYQPKQPNQQPKTHVIAKQCARGTSRRWPTHTHNRWSHCVQPARSDAGRAPRALTHLLLP